MLKYMLQIRLYIYLLGINLNKYRCQTAPPIFKLKPIELNLILQIYLNCWKTGNPCMTIVFH